MDHYIKHLGVPDEVGRFTTEDLSAFQTTTEEIVVNGENKLLVTHRFPEIRLPISLIETTPFPDVLDEITPEQLEQAALLLDERITHLQKKTLNNYGYQNTKNLAGSKVYRR
jgi:hypothetical protein